MKKYKFRNELSEAADKVYTNSSFVFYKDEKDIFYCSDNGKSKPYEIGTLEDVEEYLMMFADDEE